MEFFILIAVFVAGIVYGWQARGRVQRKITEGFYPSNVDIRDR